MHHHHEARAFVADTLGLLFTTHAGQLPEGTGNDGIHARLVRQPQMATAVRKAHSADCADAARYSFSASANFVRYNSNALPRIASVRDQYTLRKSLGTIIFILGHKDERLADENHSVLVI